MLRVKNLLIVELDGKIEFSRNFNFNRKKLSQWQYINKIGEINLSEDETVSVIEMVTRVDLGEIKQNPTRSLV